MIEKGTYIFSLWYIFIFFDFNVALDLICKICVSFDMYSKFEIYIINRELLKSEIEQCWKLYSLFLNVSIFIYRRI